MKTLQECKDEVARKYDCKDWTDLRSNIGHKLTESIALDEVAEVYARSKWDEAVEADRQIMIASMPVGTELKAWDFVIWAKNHFESSKPEF